MSDKETAYVSVSMRYNSHITLKSLIFSSETILKWKRNYREISFRCFKSHRILAGGVEKNWVYQMLFYKEMPISIPSFQKLMIEKSEEKSLKSIASTKLSL